MMKFQATLVTGLAALLVAPRMTLGQDEVAALENALAQTVRALEVVSGLETRLAVEPEATVPLVITATEATALGVTEETLDGRLASLRSEVSLLRMDLDALENPMAGDPRTAPTAVRAPDVSTGLDESILSLMRRSVDPGADPTGPQPGPTASTTPARTTKSPTIDPSQYTADPLGQAKASYNAGRYEDGVLLLEGRTDDASRYWLARCLTRLERYDEAVKLLEDVVRTAGDTYEGRRAATDLEFAKWKRDFDQKLPQGLKKGKDA